MSFKEGDLVVATRTFEFATIVPKGAVGRIVGVANTGLGYYVVFFNQEGVKGRTIWVLNTEIEKYDPVEKTSFVTKEEFVANADKMYTAFSNLSNRVQALEDQRKEEEILQVKKPLFKVGDIVRVRDRILLGWGKVVSKGQSVKIVDVEIDSCRYVAGAIITDLDGKYIDAKAVVFDEHQLEVATMPNLVQCEEQYEPDVKVAIEQIQKVCRDLLNEVDHYYRTNKQQEWQQKATALLDALSSIREAFKAKS